MPRASQPSRGETNPPPTSGYPTAYDIPQFKKMREEMTALQLLLVLKPSMRGEFEKLKTEFERIVGTVERFYKVLGERHWVFHDNLKLEPLVAVLRAEDPDEAESALIAQYQDAERMKWVLMRTKNVREMRARAELIDAAYRDYHEGRYYAVVLVLLTVMDGFVNDVGQNRRGLHTRDGEELVAWGSVTAHHQGLASTQASFTKSFNKTNTDPVFELYRNGIVHGNLTNYDNLVVASKAWNRLFAVIDWAQALDKAKVPEPPTPSLGESLRKLADTGRQKREMEKWKPRAKSVERDGLEAVMGEPVVRAAASMLDAWKSKNYGRLAPFMHEFVKPKSRNAFIGQVRSRFEATRLESYDLLRVELRGPGCAHVWVHLTVEGSVLESEMRWLYVDADKHVQVETDPRGKWQTVQTDPLSIVGRAW